MDLACFETFLKVVETGSFSQAAKALNFSQPAVSFQIQALEKEYGDTLFDRSSGTIKLTESGKIFHKYAKELLRLNQLTKESLDELKGEVRGNLYLGASNIPGEYILPKLLGRFKQKYPEVKINLEVEDTEKIIEMLEHHQVDIGFIGTSLESPTLKSIKFAQDELVFVFPTSQSYPKKSNLSLKDVLKTPFVSREEGSGTRKTLEKALEKRGYSSSDLNVVMKLGSTQAVLSAVEAGLGATAVSKWALDKVLKAGSVKSYPVKDFKLNRDLCLAYNSKQPLTRTQKEFITFAIEKVKK